MNACSATEAPSDEKETPNYYIFVRGTETVLPFPRRVIPDGSPLGDFETPDRSLEVIYNQFVENRTELGGSSRELEFRNPDWETLMIGIDGGRARTRASNLFLHQFLPGELFIEGVLQPELHLEIVVINLDYREPVDTHFYLAQYFRFETQIRTRCFWRSQSTVLTLTTLEHHLLAETL